MTSPCLAKTDKGIVTPLTPNTPTINPNQPHILNALALALLLRTNRASEDPSKALELAQQACGLTQSRNPECLNTLAIAYATVNNFSEAIKASEAGLALAQAKGDPALVTKLQKQLDVIKEALAESKEELQSAPVQLR